MASPHQSLLLFKLVSSSGAAYRESEDARTTIAFASYLEFLKQTPMSLLRLPCELLLLVAEFLETEEDINALSQVNRVLHAVINPYLYRFNAWNSESSALVWAAAHGVEDTAWISIREGAFPDAGDESGLTAMSIAAMNGHEEMVHLLLETGKVDLNAVDFELGRGPLGWAAGNGHAGVVQLLLESGLVDVNSSDSLFLTPLTLAAQSGDEAEIGRAHV